LKKSQNWYQWFASFYDLVTDRLEGSGFADWRKRLWSQVEGRKILEVGVGTGRSFPYYPSGAEIIAIDLSEEMLKRAREKARRQNIRVQLELMDVQKLALVDTSFDAVVSSLAFCEVSDPVKGLEEVKRVTRSGGKVVMLEHVISDNRNLSRLMNLMNLPLAALTGENINRDTVSNVRKSGLIVEKVTRLSSVFRLIEARKERIYMLK
jgi:phosphatidylethanolamine/phosphatidyl-N-methylethanolamine N-methyltransferase